MRSNADLQQPLEAAAKGLEDFTWHFLTIILRAICTLHLLLTGIASDMARGHQKFQSQQKNAKKQADIKKSKGHDQKAAAMAALVYTCTVCRTQMPDPKTFKQHFESKHPKSPMPPELVDVEA